MAGGGGEEEGSQPQVPELKIIRVTDGGLYSIRSQKESELNRQPTQFDSERGNRRKCVGSCKKAIQIAIDWLSNDLAHMTRERQRIIKGIRRE